MNRRLLSRLLLTSLVSLTLVGVTLAQSGGKPDDKSKQRDDKKLAREIAKRYEKLDREDRVALEANKGFVAPEFTSGINWVGDNGAPSMKSLRGKVVVIQTFNTKSSSAKLLPDRVAKALADFKAEDVQLIAIHSPEGAEKAEASLKGKTEVLTGVDRDGAFHDAIGAYKKPVNVIVDRTGNIRESGLTTEGLVDFVTEIVAEPFEAATKPMDRPPETSTARKDFPAITGKIDYAIDLRGKSAPRLPNVEWWWNRKPDIGNRLVVVDFWATWCGPCRAAIPHMNEIVKEFGRDVACMGISDEAPGEFDRGLRKYQLNDTSFNYFVGTDPTASMKKGFGVTGIPHVAVISTDGIVRWQGMPTGLTPNILKQLIEANRSLSMSGDKGSAGDRWKRDLEAEKSRGGGKNRDTKKGY